MTERIDAVGVCGASGTMGAGIAIVSARGGFRTICFDTRADSFDTIRERIGAFFAASVKRGRMSEEEREATIARLEFVAAPDKVAECGLVIEAIFEGLDAKRELFGRLDAICPEPTIFASNTSTLSITEIAAGCKRPDRVVGLHFCLPAQLMKLVEVSPGLLTSEATLARAWEWTKQCGQQPVRTEDKPGFILNALLVPFNNDAIRAVEAGVASPADIDTAIKTGLGYKMGPLELLDLIGLDTQVRLCEAFYPITLNPRTATPPLLRRMVAANLLGRKTGRGFFAYEDGKMFGA